VDPLTQKWWSGLQASAVYPANAFRHSEDAIEPLLVEIAEEFGNAGG